MQILFLIFDNVSWKCEKYSLVMLNGMINLYVNAYRNSKPKTYLL